MQEKHDIPNNDWKPKGQPQKKIIMMKLMILWGQRKESYPGEFAPEALNCWTELDVDENPEGFEKDCEAKKKLFSGHFIAFLVIPIEVDEDKIRNLLVGTAEPLKGEIQCK